MGLWSQLFLFSFPVLSQGPGVGGCGSIGRPTSSWFCLGLSRGLASQVPGSGSPLQFQTNQEEVRCADTGLWGGCVYDWRLYLFARVTITKHPGTRRKEQKFVSYSYGRWKSGLGVSEIGFSWSLPACLVVGDLSPLVGSLEVTPTQPWKLCLVRHRKLDLLYWCVLVRQEADGSPSTQGKTIGDSFSIDWNSRQESQRS